ncbi:MAG: hypothetical protein KDE31_10615, partial [Caldilineaceae bacterium]|nr:hypothetical protein [Caldilineaceae bacterium]
AEFTYASFLLLFIGLAFLWSLGHRHLIVRRVISFGLLGLVFLVGIAPFLWAMIPDMRAEGDFFTSGGGFADTYSADLLGYLLPMQRHPWLDDWVDQFPFPHDKGQHIYLGYSALALALAGAVAWWRQKCAHRWVSFWLVATLFFWWMTLGAQLRWNGRPLPIPGPFALISQLPFFSGNRYPSRYSVMLMLCIAVLAAVGLTYLLSRLSVSRHALSRSLLVLVSGLFLVEHLAVPMPLSDFRIPALYERLAATPGDFTLLELPTGWRNGARVMGKSDILIMMQQWYQTAHGKRRLGGNTSRNPLYKFQYFSDAPLIGDLIALMNATPSADPNQNELPRQVEASFDELVARNRAVAPTVLDFLGVHYVTVHVEKTPPLLQRFVAEVLPLTLIEQWQGTDWSGAPATIDLYAVTPQPVQPQWSIELAATTSTLYLAEGWATLPWQGVRYATRPCATLLLDLPTHPGRLTLQLAEPAT